VEQSDKIRTGTNIGQQISSIQLKMERLKKKKRKHYAQYTQRKVLFTNIIMKLQKKKKKKTCNLRLLEGTSSLNEAFITNSTFPPIGRPIGMLKTGNLGESSQSIATSK
jgi:hypothetical protein